MKRLTLRQRAAREADSWAAPVAALSGRDARFRVIVSWLAGYEAARRDARKAKAREGERIAGVFFPDITTVKQLAEALTEAGYSTAHGQSNTEDDQARCSPENCHCPSSVCFYYGERTPDGSLSD